MQTNFNPCLSSFPVFNYRYIISASCSYVLNCSTLFIVASQCSIGLYARVTARWNEYESLYATCKSALTMYQFPLKITNSSHEKLVVEIYRNHLLANVNSSSGSLYVIDGPSVVCLSVVCNVRALRRLKFSAIFLRHVVPWPSMTFV